MVSLWRGIYTRLNTRNIHKNMYPLILVRKYSIWFKQRLSGQSKRNLSLTVITASP